jgi:hypothetical protein
VNEFFAWLEATGLATWTRESTSLWAYPSILTLHTIGLGIVVGGSAVIDLRLLGFARRIPIASLSGVFRIIWCAFAVNAATGVLLFMADATTKSHQPVFYIKLTLIALALWTTMATRKLVKAAPDLKIAAPGLEGVAPDLKVGPTSLPARAGRVAFASLLLWTGAIVAGRLMAYL